MDGLELDADAGVEEGQEGLAEEDRNAAMTRALARGEVELIGGAADATDHLLAGEYALDNGDGGPGVGSFHSTFSMPDLSFRWTNQDSIGTVAASQDLTVTWKAGSPDGYVEVAGGYARAPALDIDNDYVEFSFDCVESADKGTLTIPGSVLWRAKGSPVPDLMLVLSVTNTVSRRFMAPRLDMGQFMWSTGFTKLVKFQW